MTRPKLPLQTIASAVACTTKMHSGSQRMDDAKLDTPERLEGEVAASAVPDDGNLVADGVHHLEEMHWTPNEVGAEGKEAEVDDDHENDYRVDPVGKEGGFEAACDCVRDDAEGLVDTVKPSATACAGVQRRLTSRKLAAVTLIPVRAEL